MSLIRALAGGATVGLLLIPPSAPAFAQSGWWEEPLAPPPPPGPIYVDPPPVIYGDPPPGYTDPPPGYEPAPYDEASPDGWTEPPPRRGRLVLGPDGTYLIEPLPDHGWGEEEVVPLPEDDYAAPYPDEERSGAWVDGYNGTPDYTNRPGSGGPSSDPYGVAPPAGSGQGLDEPRLGQAMIAPRLGLQLDILATYAPAKRAAVKLNDPFAKAEAVKKANTWLVSASVEAATEGTIRGIDRVLGIDVSDRTTTALPGAGTTVDRPKVKAQDPVNEGAIARIATYADARSQASLEPEGPTRDSAVAAAATLLLGQGSAEKALDAAEVAGIDAFLGFSGGQAMVQAPADGGPGTVQ